MDCIYWAMFLKGLAQSAEFSIEFLFFADIFFKDISSYLAELREIPEKNTCWKSMHPAKMPAISYLNLFF